MRDGRPSSAVPLSLGAATAPHSIRLSALAW